MATTRRHGIGDWRRGQALGSENQRAQLAAKAESINISL
jgi:hypothetical protein